MTYTYKIVFLTLLYMAGFANPLFAGPPYDTDDPQPVDYQHWEVYCSSIGQRVDGIYTGTAPHIEVNYGAVPNLQLHVIAPMAFYHEPEEKTNYGFGDMELGTKYRFVGNDSSVIQIGLFPLVELATGSASENLGNGKPQLYIPVWIQGNISKKFSSYGGGGYWINPGPGNRNYEFIGIQAQYQFVKPANIGAEIYYITPQQTDGKSDLRFRIGSVIDVTDHHHILLSIGRSIIGDTSLLWYFGYQLTI